MSGIFDSNNLVGGRTPQSFEGGGAPLILGPSGAADFVPSDDNVKELRRRELVKLGFPEWVFEPGFPPNVAPVLAVFARAQCVETFGQPDTVFADLLALVKRCEGTRGDMTDPAARRKHNGAELKRLIRLADFIVRSFIPAGINATGHSDPARMFRGFNPIRVAGDVKRAAEVIDQLAGINARTFDPNALNQTQFLVHNLILFAGFYINGLLALLRHLQDALLPKPGEDNAGAAATADVVEVDGGMVNDLVTHAVAVYGAAATLAGDSLGGAGARREVDTAGRKCLVELIDLPA